MTKDEEFRVIVAGSRNFNNYALLEATLDKLLVRKANIVIVNGAARGADTLGEQYAAARGLKCIRMPADWDKHGKSAGYKRNEEMAKIGHAAVLFWDGVSRGTERMANLAQRYKLAIRVIKI